MFYIIYCVCHYTLNRHKRPHVKHICIFVCTNAYISVTIRTTASKFDNNTRMYCCICRVCSKIRPRPLHAHKLIKIDGHVLFKIQNVNFWWEQPFLSSKN